MFYLEIIVREESSPVSGDKPGDRRIVSKREETRILETPEAAKESALQIIEDIFDHPTRATRIPR